MNDIVISVRNLGKCYKIRRSQGHKQYTALRDVVVSKIADAARRLYSFRRRNLGIRSKTEEFWAFEDVNFNVRQGETVAIIGRNGAGKSTLLKTLSRITRPTTGTIEINGRMASLLEVGTGFHPELTGRENVYLNGAILGMKKGEIKRKFDEIVAFAEVEKFLDTPVKRYSSGMYVRLAFAVPAFLDPEILIVDEVLAVGDLQFQKKCLGKMGEVARSGRTVLFVSHNMAAVAELCERAIWLADGKVLMDGPAVQVMPAYIMQGSGKGTIDLTNWALDRSGGGHLRVISLCTEDGSGLLRSIFSTGESIRFRVTVAGMPGQKFTMGVNIRDGMGVLLIHLASLDVDTSLELPSTRSDVKVTLPNLPLNDGDYFITIWLGNARNELSDRVDNCLSFSIDNSMLGKIYCESKIRLEAGWEVSGSNKERDHNRG